MVGRTILHYKILERLGKGGMGEVWKAEDTQLRRIVALKFLSSEAIGDEEILARLIREAQASASLDHPNICAVYGIHEEKGETFIAMAYIEGPSLADKIKERPLPLAEALDLAIQIAEGLQEAHEKGIVHRDVKPQNIMLTAKGQVKIMDFGLASLSGRSKLTKSGTTLGTPAYMAPEQLEGGGVDRRADIWALGCALYEMLTQRTPFDADYEQAIAYGILNEEPEPVTALRSGLPMELERIVQKCLAKQASQRYQGTRELGIDLGALRRASDPRAAGRTQTLAAEKRTAEAEVAVGARRRKGALIGLALTASVALAAAVVVWLNQPAPRSSVVKLVLSDTGGFRDLVVSPDGRHLAYVAGVRNETSLWVRDLDQEEPRQITGPGQLAEPFWSPDSAALAFFDGQELKRISIEGGPAFTVCQLLGGAYGGGAWSPDGKSMVFSSSVANRVLFYVVSAQGGTPSLLFEPEHAQPIVGHPHFLPSTRGESKLLYATWRSAPTGARDAEIFLRDLASDRTDRIARGRNPVYSASGHIIFESLEAPVGVWAVPFSVDTSTTTEEPFLIRGDAFDPSVSANEILTYQAIEGGAAVRLVWRGRKGKFLGTISQPQPVMLYPALSPDGSRIAVRSSEGDGIWIHELERGVRTRISSAMGAAHWSPTSDELVFSVRPEGSLDLDIYRQSADGSGDAKPLHSAEGIQFASHWSSDDRFILYDHQAGEAGSRGLDVWYLHRRDDDAGFDATPFLTSGATEKAAMASPDSSYVAYVSDESGEYEVYVQRFPEGGRKKRISPSGGTQPRWSRDGTELYYVNRDELIVVPIGLGEELTVGAAEPLFRDPALRGSQHPHYDVSADGQRFVVRQLFSEDGEQSSVRAVLVLNWHEEFRDRE